MHDEAVVLAREVDDALEEREVDDLGGGLAGKLRMRSFGFGHVVRTASCSSAEEVAARHERDRAQVAAGDDHRVLVDRIRRARAEDDVARARASPSARCPMPSFEPMVTIASRSGSSSTP